MRVHVLSLLLGLGSVHADEGPLDDLGCHVSQEQTNYHCHAGPLAGARYADRAAAEDALAARAQQKSERAAKREASLNLDLISWTFDGTNPDVERTAGAVSAANLVVLRGLGAGGEAFANKLAMSVDARVHRKICRGYRAGEVYLWRDDELAFARKDGTLGDGCGARAYEVGEGAVVFLFKQGRRLFTIGPAGVSWPALVTADKFPNADKLGFKAVVKRAAENVWTRDLYVIDARVVKLRDLYSDLKTRELTKRVGTHQPIQARLSFTEPTAEMIQFVKREAAPKRAKPADEPRFDAYPGAVDSKDLSLVEEDLESEERASRPNAVATGKKTRKNR